MAEGENPVAGCAGPKRERWLTQLWYSLLYLSVYFYYFYYYFVYLLVFYTFFILYLFYTNILFILYTFLFIFWLINPFLFTGFDVPKRKYDPEYITYGFIAIEHGGEALPQCVVCMKLLSNAAIKPSLLKYHLENNHADKKDRDQSYFQRLGENVKRQRMDKTGQIYQKGARIVKASYEVAFLVAKSVKAHTIAVSLCERQRSWFSHVIGEEAVARLECFRL